jgi:hypothetical protein
MKLLNRTLAAFALAALAATSAYAGAGGESNNTGCNGQGNANSPCSGGHGGWHGHVPTPPVIVTGPPGPVGPQGPAGPPGVGTPGRDGTNGTNGTNGVDGVAVNGVNGTNGRDGASIQGERGETGAPGVAPPDTATVQQVTNANNAVRAETAAQINSLRGELQGVAKAAYSGIAAAMAVQSPMPNLMKPDALVMRVGAGFYKGQSAVGVSFRKGNKEGDWSVTGGVSATSYGTAVAVGVEHSF